MSVNPKRWLEAFVERKMVQNAAKLLNEQCWCWGADIRYRDGNLLLTYGFQRERAPSPTEGSNCYHLHLSPTRSVTLWGWGLFYGDSRTGGLLLGRNGFTPLYTHTDTLSAPIFKPSDLPLLRSPSSEKEYQLVGDLLGGALHWMADYERWVVAQVGEPYRCTCLQEWRKRPVERVLTATSWRYFADEMKRALQMGAALSA